MGCHRLPPLRDLRLHTCTAAAEEYEPLGSLPALERLSLTACLQLPDCLGWLPTLKLLSISCSPLLTFEDADAEKAAEWKELRAELLDEALEALIAAQLTQLQLGCDHSTAWPSALTDLQGLQALVLTRCTAAAPLPGGPWLACAALCSVQRLLQSCCLRWRLSTH